MEPNSIHTASDLTDNPQDSASIENVRPHQSHHLPHGGGFGSTDGSNDNRTVQSLGANHNSFTGSSQQHQQHQQRASIDHSDSRLYAGQSPKEGGASHAAVPTLAHDAPQKSPQSQSQSGTMIEADVMRTYLSSSKDALGVLFKAAEQRDTPGDQVENHDSNSALAFHDSPTSAYTSGAVPAPIPPSKLSSPAPAVLEAWEACRFIRQGWFSAREAVTYIDL